MGTKNKRPVVKAKSNHSNINIPGILCDNKGIAFSSHNLPSSDHFFTATDYKIDNDEEYLYILFGQSSRFSQKDSSLRLAIEIMFPIKLAKGFLYESIFNRPSISTAEGQGATFFESVSEVIKNRTGLKEYSKELVLPEGGNNYRQFSSNYSSSSMSNGQGLVEFFEASPDLLVNLVHQTTLRPNMGVKPVVSVLTSESLLYSFFSDIKQVFDKGEPNV